MQTTDEAGLHTATPSTDEFGVGAPSPSLKQGNSMVTYVGSIGTWLLTNGHGDIVGDYAKADPVNIFDLDGRCTTGKTKIHCWAWLTDWSAPSAIMPDFLTGSTLCGYLYCWDHKGVQYRERLRKVWYCGAASSKFGVRSRSAACTRTAGGLGSGRFPDTETIS